MSGQSTPTNEEAFDQDNSARPVTCAKKNGVYFLKWNGHTSGLLSTFKKNLDSKYLVDATIVCAGHHIRVHRLILTACSRFFYDSFQGRNDNWPMVLLKGITFNTVMQLLEYMYVGHVKIPVEEADLFVKAADYLQIRGLWPIQSIEELMPTETDDDEPSSNDDVTHVFESTVDDSNVEITALKVPDGPSTSMETSTESDDSSPSTSTGTSEKRITKQMPLKRKLSDSMENILATFIPEDNLTVNSMPKRKDAPKASTVSGQTDDDQSISVLYVVNNHTDFLNLPFIINIGKPKKRYSQACKTSNRSVATATDTNNPGTSGSESAVRIETAANNNPTKRASSFIPHLHKCNILRKRSNKPKSRE